MTTTTSVRRPVTRILAPLMLVGMAGSIGVIRGEAASPSGLSATPAASQTSHTRATPASHGVRLTVSSGTSAEYRARERLAFFSFPTDAVGTTTAVEGGIVLDARGHIVSSKSTFVIDLRTLKSDKSQRDQFIQSNTLQTAQYPDAVFNIKQAVGLPASLPTSGTIHFSLVGTLTVHGVTQPTTWTVTATLGRHTVTGVATSQVKMTAFHMTPPQVGPVLSVNDTMTLEINARMARTTL